MVHDAGHLNASQHTLQFYINKMYVIAGFRRGVN